MRYLSLLSFPFQPVEYIQHLVPSITHALWQIINSDLCAYHLPYLLVSFPQKNIIEFDFLQEIIVLDAWVDIGGSVWNLNPQDLIGLYYTYMF